MSSAKPRNHIKLLLKIVLAALLIVLVFKVTGASVKGVGQSLGAIPRHWPWFVLAVLLHVPGYLLQALRWGGLLRAQGMHVRMPALLESYLVATFFNNVLPSSFGGDAMRAYDTGFRGRRGKAAEAAAVVLVDRLSGLVVLMLLAVVGMFFVDWRSLTGAEGRNPMFSLVLAAAVFFGLLLTMMAMLHPGIAGWFLGHIRARGAFGARLHGVLERIYNALAVYADRKTALLAALFWGLLHAVNVVVHYFILAMALGWQVDFWRDIWGFFIAVPVIQVIQAIPATPGGYGTGEAAHAMLVQFLKAPGQSAAVALRWAFIATTLVWALIGLIVFLLRLAVGHTLFGGAPTPVPEPSGETTFGYEEGVSVLAPTKKD